MTSRILGGFSRTWPGAPLMGVLTGSTLIAGSPDAPVKRRIQLFAYHAQNAHNQVFPENQVVRWAWSLPDGSWRFEGLDPTMKYGIIAYDHTGQHDPVVKLNLVPSVEE